MMASVISLLVMLVSISSVSARSDGAPALIQVCDNLLPWGHRSGGSFNPQPFPAFYEITTNFDSYQPRQEILVTLTGLCGAKFRGFVIQARLADPNATSQTGLGVFANMDTNSKPLCDEDLAITHTNNNDKESVQVKWTAPAANVGHIVFMATIVETFSKYWIRHTSEVIRDSAIQAEPPRYSGIPTEKVSSSNCPQQPAPPTVGRFKKPPECGTTMGCFSDCDSTDCSFIIGWRASDDGVHIMFTIRANYPETSEDVYMAMGLSDDQRMGEDGVTECVYQKGNMAVYNSRNTQRTNKRYSQTAAVLNSGSYENGVFQCVFDLPLTGTPEDALFDLTRDRYMLFARGTGFTDDNVAKHSETPLVSAAAADFQSMGEVNTGSVLTLIKVHGSLMVAAWLFTASLGIVVARYFKPQWPEETCCGQKVWFRLHQNFMVLTFCLAVTGFVVIFVYVQGWSEPGEETYKKAHPILGVIVTALCVLNPIMALFRPHPGTPNRPIFNWAHFGVGSTAQILGVVTIFLGVSMGKPAVPGYVLWILVAYVAWQVLLELCLVCFRCSSDSKPERREAYEMTQRGEPVDKKPEPQYAYSPLRQGLLMAHIIVITGLAVTVIILIVMAE